MKTIKPNNPDDFIKIIKAERLMDKAFRIVLIAGSVLGSGFGYYILYGKAGYENSSGLFSAIILGLFIGGLTSVSVFWVISCYLVILHKLVSTCFSYP